MAAEVLATDSLGNYLSVLQNEGEAEVELNRYENAGYLKRISKKEAREKYGAGTVSKLGWSSKPRRTGL